MTVKLLSRELLTAAMCDVCISHTVDTGTRLPDRISTWEHPATRQRLCHEHAHPYLAGAVTMTGSNRRWHLTCSHCNARAHTSRAASVAAWRYQHDLSCAGIAHGCRHTHLVSGQGNLTCAYCGITAATS